MKFIRYISRALYQCFSTGSSFENLVRFVLYVLKPTTSTKPSILIPLVAIVIVGVFLISYGVSDPGTSLVYMFTEL